jgi:glycosyltransferase involved in cell wall biosynthesis
MTDRLRVGMLAPVAWRVPPLHYGPWERVVSILTEGLVARGVDVTLFATADSVTRARLVAVVPRGYAEDSSLDAKVVECLHIAAAFEQASADAFDILHNHFDFLPLTYSRLVSTPVVTTVHGFSSERILPVYRAYMSTSHLVAISDSDKRADLDYAATIHHGIPLDEFTFRDGPGEYLLFFGRIHPDKGAREAIDVARRTGRNLILAGIIQDADYFRAAVEPFVDGDRIRYVGSVGAAQRDALLGGAAALLHLIHFDEPFGLSVVEAMATGTPVIAFARGSMPELIEQGVSGFLIPPGDHDAAVTAVSRIAELDRSEARTHVERHFSAERMVDDYLRLYRRLVAQDRERDLNHFARHSQASTAEPVELRRARPAGARCDACHTRQSHVQRSRDGLLTICKPCARGVDLTTTDAAEVIAAVASRAPVGKRRALTRRLLARRAMHAGRRDRKSAPADSTPSMEWHDQATSMCHSVG